ncbi:hypothetical protein F4778DRAFT_711860 [Xylariomycetidae sp. FL2044]|nr:hypothetical protein F4778DRAFT_711860 [Xylariomycetidae sp. FL2044]
MKPQSILPTIILSLALGTAAVPAPSESPCTWKDPSRNGTSISCDYFTVKIDGNKVTIIDKHGTWFAKNIVEKCDGDRKKTFQTDYGDVTVEAGQDCKGDPYNGAKLSFRGSELDINGSPACSPDSKDRDGPHYCSLKMYDE